MKFTNNNQSKSHQVLVLCFTEKDYLTKYQKTATMHHFQKIGQAVLIGAKSKLNKMMKIKWYHQRKNVNHIDFKWNELNWMPDIFFLNQHKNALFFIYKSGKFWHSKETQQIVDKIPFLMVNKKDFYVRFPGMKDEPIRGSKHWCLVTYNQIKRTFFLYIIQKKNEIFFF